MCVCGILDRNLNDEEDEDENILVPLVYCMVVDEYRFNLNSAQES